MTTKQSFLNKHPLNTAKHRDDIPRMAETDMQKLRRRLERLYATYDHAFLSSDPIEFVHRFKAKRDREVVGLIASSLAYGRVDTIKRSIQRVLDIMGWKPYTFTVNFDPAKDGRLFSGFKHRFNDGRDISCLIYFARQMIEGYGSIGAFFNKGYKPVHANIKEALISFSERTLALDTAGLYGTERLPERAGVRFFFPSPAAKSPCKRLNLYLRWMVRSADSLDFGLWKGINPSKLVIPLDTHIARISGYIGLTGRTTPDWKMAEEITENLKRLDPSDPVKYDFALSRLGILEECRRKRDAARCRSCLIKDICIIA